MKAYSLIFVITALIYDVASKIVFVKAFDLHHRFSQVGKKKKKNKKKEYIGSGHLNPDK